MSLNYKSRKNWSAGKRIFPYIGKRAEMFYSLNMVGRAVFSSVMDYIRLDTTSLDSYEEVLKWLRNKGHAKPEEFTSKIYEEEGKITELSLPPVSRFYYIVLVGKVLEVFDEKKFNRQFNRLN